MADEYGALGVEVGRGGHDSSAPTTGLQPTEATATRRGRGRPCPRSISSPAGGKSASTAAILISPRIRSNNMPLMVSRGPVRIRILPTPGSPGTGDSRMLKPPLTGGKNTDFFGIMLKMA
jgi:hypothetical protein